MTIPRALLLMAMLGGGCSPSARQATPSGGGHAGTEISVTTIQPTRKTLRKLCTQPGQIVAFEEAPIYAKVAGYVQHVAVDIGDAVRGPRLDEQGRFVEPGQVLAELSVPELQDDVTQQQALVAQAEARIEQSQAALKLAEAGLATARARCRESAGAVARASADVDRWQSEHERVAELAADGAVTQKLVDESRNQLKSAEAAHDEAEARVEGAAATLAEAEAAVGKAQSDGQVARAQHEVAVADLQRAKTMFDYSTLRAPFDGVVTSRTANLGHYVQAGNASEEPLFVVMQTDRMRVFLDVPEQQSSFVAPGREAVITPDAGGLAPITGQVTRTAWALNASTRTLRTEIDVPNPAGRLRPGMYVHASVVLEELPDALAVPRAAVVFSGATAHCVVVRDSKAERVPVVVGWQVGEDVQVVSGLTGSETIVSQNPAQLQAGQRIRIAASGAANLPKP